MITVVTSGPSFAVLDLGSAVPISRGSSRTIFRIGSTVLEEILNVYDDGALDDFLWDCAKCGVYLICEVTWRDCDHLQMEIYAWDSVELVIQHFSGWEATWND
ncbi:hypothetical protein PGT21_001843 [Puccinia graminis f. sp. tritici]|uniref:Uncharacterized protein n=1 Tax=Puccinia graminis f. sp. tritici TaxID=56615 RepID=A0A5B0QSM1_PUCGR|nr:hypothetical protein PGT21_001843 [Puccinia graminis f. sp. tritici]